MMKRGMIKSKISISKLILMQFTTSAIPEERHRDKKIVFSEIAPAETSDTFLANIFTEGSAIIDMKPKMKPTMIKR